MTGFSCDPFLLLANSFTPHLDVALVYSIQVV
jgi:hypothetical protein